MCKLIFLAITVAALAIIIAPITTIEPESTFIETFNEILKICVEIWKLLKQKLILILQGPQPEPGPQPDDTFANLTDALQKLYKNRLLPLEQVSKYYEPSLVEEDFEAKPIVLLVGEQNTGKTTFINYLLGEEYQGSKANGISSTNNFIAIKYGNQTDFIDGEVEVKDSKSQFRHLVSSEGVFLKHFKVGVMPNRVLEAMSFIDTPGVFNAVTNHNYDFMKNLKWFVEHSERILLFFEPSKVHINPEMEKVIKFLMKYDDKIKFIFNRAHELEELQLLRAFAGLKFYLGKVIDKLEKPRFYISSFKNDIGPLSSDHQKDHDDILNDLGDLPNKLLYKKLSRFNERAKRVLMHAYLIEEIQNRTAASPNKDDSIKELIGKLKDLVEVLKSKYPMIETGDYDLDLIKEKLLKLVSLFIILFFWKIFLFYYYLFIFKNFDKIEIRNYLVDNASTILNQDCFKKLRELLENEKDLSIHLSRKNTEL